MSGRKAPIEQQIGFKDMAATEFEGFPYLLLVALEMKSALFASMP